MSSNFQTLDINLITVDPARQRKKIDGIEELADSIRRLGLLHPIVVRRDHVLVAGERRLRAHKHLGYTHIQVHFTDELDELQLRAMELEENTKRKDLTWQEEVAAIEAFHKLKCELDPDWNQSKTAEALGVSNATITDKLAVAEKITDESIKAAPKFSVARGIVQRAASRAAEIQLDDLLAREGTTPNETESPISCADFTQWVKGYSGPRYNFIHCDFPYGIGADAHNQGGAKAHGGYADTAEIYWGLLECLVTNTSKLISDQAHLMFWLHPRYLFATKQILEEYDWEINDYPLIWYKTNNAGIIPNPSHDPRQIYEICLFATRGERKIVRSVSNAFGHDTVRDRHMSEKPEAMLAHFFRMIVDKSTLMLDPTCGSGSSIRAAEALGASLVTGLEINPEFVERAQLALTQARRERNERRNASEQ